MMSLSRHVPGVCERLHIRTGAAHGPEPPQARCCRILYELAGGFIISARARPTLSVGSSTIVGEVELSVSDLWAEQAHKSAIALCRSGMRRRARRGRRATSGRAAECSRFNRSKVHHVPFGLDLNSNNRLSEGHQCDGYRYPRWRLSQS